MFGHVCSESANDKSDQRIFSALHLGPNLYKLACHPNQFHESGAQHGFRVRRLFGTMSEDAGGVFIRGQKLTSFHSGLSINYGTTKTARGFAIKNDNWMVGVTHGYHHLRTISCLATGTCSGHGQAPQIHCRHLSHRWVEYLDLLDEGLGTDISPKGIFRRANNYRA